MSPASLDRCHCQSVRCWCTSIDLLSGTTVSLSQLCQLYNREGVLTVVFLPLASLVGIKGSEKGSKPGVVICKNSSKLNISDATKTVLFRIK